MDDVFVFDEHVKERIESSMYFLALQHYKQVHNNYHSFVCLFVCSSHGSTRQFSQHMQAGCEWREPRNDAREPKCYLNCRRNCRVTQGRSQVPSLHVHWRVLACRPSNHKDIYRTDQSISASHPWTRQDKTSHRKASRAGRRNSSGGDLALAVA